MIALHADWSPRRQRWIRASTSSGGVAVGGDIGQQGASYQSDIVLGRAVTGFHRHQTDLCCDGVPLAAIAHDEGTPLYVYSAAEIEARYRALDTAFGDWPHALHYALKANSNIAIGTLLHQLGSAADANSIWEIAVDRKSTRLNSSHT